MQRKKLLLVALVAILLTNGSIIGTLFVKGYLSDKNRPEQEPIASASEPGDRPPTPVLHSMSQAMLVCVDKLMNHNKGKNIAFDINTVASRFLEEELSYTIFIDTNTPSRVGAPQEIAEVICEVDATTMQVAGFKSMKTD